MLKVIATLAGEVGGYIKKMEVRERGGSLRVVIYITWRCQSSCRPDSHCHFWIAGRSHKGRGNLIGTNATLCLSHRLGRLVSHSLSFFPVRCCLFILHVFVSARRYTRVHKGSDCLADRSSIRDRTADLVRFPYPSQNPTSIYIERLVRSCTKASSTETI